MSARPPLRAGAALPAAAAGRPFESARVHAWVRAAILDVTLAPGAMVSESEIAQRRKTVEVLIAEKNAQETRIGAEAEEGRDGRTSKAGTKSSLVDTRMCSADLDLGMGPLSFSSSFLSSLPSFPPFPPLLPFLPSFPFKPLLCGHLH